MTNPRKARVEDQALGNGRATLDLHGASMWRQVG